MSGPGRQPITGVGRSRRRRSGSGARADAAAAGGGREGPVGRMVGWVCVSLRLIPLGTNGYIPSHGRQTMCFLLLDGEGALLLDAGTGMARLLDPRLQAMLAGVARLDILLTHYHLDHVVGLSYLPAVWRERPVRLFCPAPPLVDLGPERALGQLLSPPLFPIGISEFPSPVEVVTLDGTGEHRIGALPVRLRRQSHPGGSAGVRLGDALAYTTDTSADDATAELARGVALLLHEAWATDAEAQASDPGGHGHSAAAGVARVARGAGVARLMPVHHHPGRTEEEVRAMARSIAAQAGDGIEVVVPEEGRVYELG